ncbi:MAG: arylsulfotransferase family protein [Geminicoccaceae bacterium]
MDFVARAISVLGIAVIIFLGGMAVRHFDLWPSPEVRDAIRGAQAWLDESGHHKTLYESALYSWAHDDRTGLVVNEPEAYEGYTLYLSGHDSMAFLLDGDGNEVHRWSKRYDEVFSNPAHIDDEVDEQFVHFRRAHLFPNGDLLAIMERVGTTPYGLGLVKLDKDSNVIWAFADHTHHHLAVGEDGCIYALVHDFREDFPEGFDDRGLQTPYLEDWLVVLSPEGEELERISITNALAKGGFDDVYTRMPSDYKGDYSHTNTVTVLPADLADRFPFAKAGDLMLSLRQSHLIAFLDPQTGVVTRILSGAWRYQHDPDFLPSGNILLLDNKGHYGEGGASRVIEVDPETTAIEWSYAGTEDEPFFSDVMSSQQRLANGNTLVTESKRGRVFEVTRDGKIVWDFRNPARSEPNPEEVAVVMGAQRYSPEDLTFLNQ